MESAEWTGRVLIRVVDFVQSNLAVLLRHLLPVVFLAFLVEAASLPFPSRILLVVAATPVDEPRQLVGLVAVSTTGALIGDHVPYPADALTGPRILAFSHPRLPLSDDARLRGVRRKDGRLLRRFGAAAILLSRLSASVRLFASAMSGCGQLTYRKFVAFDVTGTLLYTTLCVTLGSLVREQVAEILRRHGAARLLVLIGPLASRG
jgi:membrane protein DedA with SNARE-associated domain